MRTVRTGDSTTKSQTSGYQADERIEPASVELTANRQEDVLAVGDRDLRGGVVPEHLGRVERAGRGHPHHPEALDGIKTQTFIEHVIFEVSERVRELRGLVDGPRGREFALLGQQLR
ncbi:hypothetical protein ABLN73_17475 [Mycobacterium tuberculosis]